MKKNWLKTATGLFAYLGTIGLLAINALGADAPGRSPGQSGNTPQAAPASRPSNAETNAAWERRLEGFNMAGSLNEAARALNEQFSEVNFIVPEHAKDAEISLRLRNVGLQEILDAIEMSSEGRIRSMRRGNMVSFNAARVASTRNDSIQCRVFRLAPYLEGKSDKESDEAVKSLYDALAVAWGMLKKYERNVEQPELTIHRETKLLIAVGREKELAVLEQVVRELQGSLVTTKAQPSSIYKPGAEPKKF